VEKPAASRTALATSLMRAAHTRLDPHHLIDDSWGDRLVPESAKRAMASRGDLLDAALMGSRSYANVITRTRRRPIFPARSYSRAATNRSRRPERQCHAKGQT